MSLDLYSDQIEESLAQRPRVTTIDPGAFDNFFSSAGNAAMQTFAKAGRSALTLAGGVATLVERAGEMHPLGGFDRTISDRLFKMSDEVGQRAVEYWTPNPTEVGAAGSVVGQLLATIPAVIASPAAVVAATQMGVAEDLTRKGVDTGKALTVGGVQGLGLGLGIWMPILGNNLWQRVVLGGVGFNVVQGAATRGASAAILEGTPGADDFRAFGPIDVTLDVLLGAAFGYITHLSPAMRRQGREFVNQLEAWGRTVKPSDVDALATLRQAQHMNVDSMPGKPVGVQDIEAHVQRMKAAIEQMANDRPVQVEDMPAPRFEADPVRMAEAEARANELVEIAEQVRQAEGLPEVRTADLDPATPRTYAPMEFSDGDPLVATAHAILDQSPDLTFSMGKDADGNSITMSARQFLDDARADVAQALDDARLFEVAARCLLGRGA